jgi:hypothetical protein
LDSFLLFRQNQRVMNQYAALHRLIWETSFEHQIIKRFGLDGAKKVREASWQTIKEEIRKIGINESHKQDHPPEQQAAPSDN